MLATIKNYSEISSIQGIVYIFASNQSLAGRFFWTSVVSLMLILGTYWSIVAYNEWEESPVLTTLTTPAMPVNDIDFPAITICSRGMNEDIFRAAVIRKFLAFAKEKGQSRQISPLLAQQLMYKKVKGKKTWASRGWCKVGTLCFFGVFRGPWQTSVNNSTPF